MDAERMNPAAHQIPGRRVNQSVPGDRIFSAKSLGNNSQLVVSAVLCASVPGMAMRLIEDVDRQRLKAGQSLTQAFNGVLTHAGKTFLNGLTVTFSYTPAAT